jgi:hypothetical protein
MVFDYFMKEFFRDIFYGSKVETDHKVGSLPLQIDCIIEIPKNVNLDVHPLPLQFITKYFRKYNIFEFKSSHDSPKKTDLVKIIGYLGLWCQQKQVEITALEQHTTLWYITANQPKFITSLIDSHKFIALSIPGLYSLTIPFPCPFYILIIDELPCTPETAPLLLLGSPNTIQKAMIALENQHLLPEILLDKYLTLIYLYYYEDVKAMTEIEHLFPPKIKNNIKLAIEEIGIDNVIEAVGLEKVINTVGVEKVINAVGVEKVINAVGVEKVEKIIQRIKNKQKQSS